MTCAKEAKRSWLRPSGGATAEPRRIDVFETGANGVGTGGSRRVLDPFATLPMNIYRQRELKRCKYYEVGRRIRGKRERAERKGIDYTGRGPQRQHG